MKKILIAMVLCAVSVFGAARTVRTVRMGNISIGKAYNGCMAGTHRSDTLYSFIVLSPGRKNQTVSIKLSADANESISILDGIRAAYHEGDTISAQNVRLLCHKGNVFQVLDMGPERKQPGEGEFWFTIRNIKHEIRVIRRNKGPLL